MLPFYLHCLSRGDDVHLSLYLCLQKIVYFSTGVCCVWQVEVREQCECVLSFQNVSSGIEPESSSLMEGACSFTI